MVIDFLESTRTNRIQGVVPAVVIDNKDPEGRSRVKVMFPQWLCKDAKYTDEADDEDFVSAWARMVSLMAGPQRGAFFLPEPDDEVLVVFESGDIRYPYIIGALWNGVDAPVHDNNAQDGNNGYRTLKSRSGHVLTFMDDVDGKDKVIIQTKTADGDENKDASERDGHYIVLDHTDGEEKIEIYDRKQNNYILIDSSNDKIVIESKEGDLEIRAKNKIILECDTLETHSKSNTKMKVDGSMDVKVSQGLTMDGGPKIKQKASRIDLN
jgi:uncharacterized protein involved in type VI secretion and phage assembly